MTNLSEFLPAIPFAIFITLLVWFFWIGLSFGYKERKGARLTIGQYKKARIQIGVLTFLSVFFFALWGIFNSNNFNTVNSENAYLALLGLGCCPSAIAILSLIAFRFPKSRFMSDDD